MALLEVVSIVYEAQRTYSLAEQLTLALIDYISHRFRSIPRHKIDSVRWAYYCR